MQYIAEDPVHVVARNEQAAIVDPQSRGVIQPMRRRLFAKFQRGTAPGWARQIGLETFEFRKAPQGVTPSQWLAFYDSLEAQQEMGWTDEERETIDAKLLTIAGVLVVERPKLSAPWPAYDSLVAAKGGPTRPEVAEKISSIVEDLGLNPHDVLAYEQQELDRPEVVTALQTLLPHAPAPLTGDLFAGDEEGELIEA